MAPGPRSTKASSKQKLPLTSEQKEMAPWLAKLPTNPHDKSSDSVLRQKATMQCFCLLWKNPSLSHTCKMWLEDRIAKPEEIDLNTTFDPEPTSVGNIPTDWLCSYLIGMGVGWSETLLGRAKAYDKSQIVNLACGYLNVSPQMKLGEGAADKVIVKRAFDKRRGQIKPRFAAVKNAATAAKAVDEVGQMQFGSFGIYKLHIDDKTKCATNVTHVPSGETTKITSKNIDHEWYLDKNYSDTKSLILMQGSKTDKHFLVDYFAKETGPHKEPMLVGNSAQWYHIMQEVGKEVNQQRGEAKEVGVAKTTAELELRTKEAAQASAQKARVRMHEKQEERSKRARTQVTT